MFAIGSKVWPGLSKLIEEAGEVAQVAGKLIAVGGASGHWDGSDLTRRMVEELADLGAAIDFVIEANDLPAEEIATRRLRKLVRFRAWHGKQQAPDAPGRSSAAASTYNPQLPTPRERVREIAFVALAVVAYIQRNERSPETLLGRAEEVADLFMATVIERRRRK